MASKQIPLFDAHCDTLSRLTLHPDEKLFEAHGQWNLALSARCKPQAQFFAVYWDSKMPLAKYFAKRQRKTFLRNCSMAGDKVALCRTADEAREAAYATASPSVPISSTSPMPRASAPVQTRPWAISSTASGVMSRPSATMFTNCV